MDDVDYKKNIEKLELQLKKSNKRVNQIRPFFYFLGLLSFLFFLINNIQNLFYLKKSVPIIGVVCLFLLFGFLMFLYRENYRLGYGILEIIVGLLVIISLFENIDDLSFIYNSTLEVYVKLGGGLYVIVRGIDNIFKNIENKKIGVWLKTTYGIGKK